MCRVPGGSEGPAALIGRPDRLTRRADSGGCVRAWLGPAAPVCVVCGEILSFSIFQYPLQLLVSPRI